MAPDYSARIDGARDMKASRTTQAQKTSNPVKPRPDRSILQELPILESMQGRQTYRKSGKVIGQFMTGITRNTLHRRGASYSLIRHIVEKLSKKTWVPVDERAFRTGKSRLRFQLYALADEVLARFEQTHTPFLSPFGRFRTRLEVKLLKYDDALHIVRDSILFPAIGASIPHCMDRDLYVSVSTTLSAGRRNHSEQLHIVGANPIEIPHGLRVAHPRRPK